MKLVVLARLTFFSILIDYVRHLSLPYLTFYFCCTLYHIFFQGQLLGIHFVYKPMSDISFKVVPKEISKLIKSCTSIFLNTVFLQNFFFPIFIIPLFPFLALISGVRNFFFLPGMYSPFTPFYPIFTHFTLWHPTWVYKCIICQTYLEPLPTYLNVL